MDAHGVEALRKAVMDATLACIHDAEVFLPPDVKEAIDASYAAETDPVARGELANIRANIETAERLNLPLCQDTGIAVIYVTVPDSFTLSRTDISSAIREAVRLATDAVPLRPNAVDPLTRENSGDNTGVSIPTIHFSEGSELSITVLPKGAGSENVSRIGMLLPSEAGSVVSFVVETVLLAGGRPCPPVVVGVGIGGTFDLAATLAKEALLLPIGTMDDFESEICEAINNLGIGPMGLGGDTTALAVKVQKAHCHTASLPVAVNIQCWACRRATRVVTV
ncbi:fumarate hydratase subunit alpha [Methanocalculus alkaliphilus]|uniref:fumarate hydratase n=1 Tax=Methanocalculus alkaliphilus TaxID=768730 RepID=UPI00209E6484|nr:fumarate hydratase [Methanocalculus alkaliphilus]MCP1715043.1 fumarate hydratase subunit alpha [Methanocalculus alkaliphilus]